MPKDISDDIIPLKSMVSDDIIPLKSMGAESAPQENIIPIADQIEKHKTTELEKLGIVGQAAWTGVLHFGSTIAKAISKQSTANMINEKYKEKTGKNLYPAITTPSGIQDYYEEQVNTLEQNKANNPNMNLGVAEFAGSILPAMLFPGGIALKAGQIGSKVLPNMAPTLGKYIGSAVGGSLEGMLFGGAMNQPGQGEDIINQQGLQTGGILGAALGPAQQFAQRYLNRTSAYEDLQNSARNIGYKGPILARDIPDTEWLDTWKRQKANMLFDNLPIIGSGSARVSAINQFRPVLTKYITDAGTFNKSRNFQSIANTLNKTVKNLDDEYNRMWTSFSEQAKNSNITKVPIENTKKIINDLVSVYDDELGKSTKKILSSLPNNPSPEQVINFKRELWPAYVNMQKAADRTKSQDMLDAANLLKQTYWSSIDDLKSAMSGDTRLLSSFETANTFTKGYKEIFDPKNNRRLINAIKSLDEDQEGLKTWANWITSDKPTERTVASSISLLGREGTEDLSKKQLNELFKKSLNTSDGSLDLGTFIKGINNIKDSSSYLISKPAIDAMEGLKFVMERNLLAIQRESKIGSVGNALLQMSAAGAVGGAVSGYNNDWDPKSMISGALKMSVAPLVLAKVSKYSPLKNSLITINRITNNPKLSQYVLETINKQMIKAGIILNHNSEGVSLGNDTNQTINNKNNTQSQSSSKQSSY